MKGPFPAAVAGLTTLERLDLSNNALNGELPDSFSDLTALKQLNLSNNELAYPNPGRDWTRYEKATARCRAGGIRCDGLPPLSCSAFAGNYFLSIKDPSTCEKCDWSPLLLFIVIAVILILAFSYFIRLILRYPRARRTWVSTITIMINHAQTLAVLAGLRLDWPCLLYTSPSPRDRG